MEEYQQEQEEEQKVENDPTHEQPTTNDENITDFIEDHEPLMESVSYYYTDNYTIELVHQITLGDILIASLVSILIIVVLLSRLLGGRR